MNVFAPSISGTDAAIFTITDGDTGGTVLPQATLTITVEIAPLSTGNKSAVLEIQHDGVNEASPLNVNLAGNCIDIPIFEITPASPFDFQKVAKGDTKTETFTVANIGGKDLTITAIAVAGDFAVTAGNAPFTITSGNTHNVEITFAPQSMGAANENIVFTSNALTSPDTLAVSGEGFRGLPFEEDFEGTANGQIPTDWTITRDSGSNTAGTNWNWQVPSWNPYQKINGTKIVVADSDHFASARYANSIFAPSKAMLLRITFLKDTY